MSSDPSQRTKASLGQRLEAASRANDVRLAALKQRILLRTKDGLLEFDGQHALKLHGRPRRSHELDGRVSASVETVEQLSARPTLARTAAGAVLAGPLGALLGATAWKKTGALFLVLEGADWAELLEVDRSQAKTARLLAEAVNLAVRRGSADLTAAADGAVSGSVVDQLERLTALRDRGALTEDEFAAQKRRVLE